MIWLKTTMLAMIDQYGVIALFVALTLETVGLPIPGESALIVTSAIASTGQINIWHVAIAGYLGAVLGDNIAYFIGRRYGRAVVLARGARFGITPERFARAEGIAQRYGPIMVIVARFVVLLRQLNGLVAGTSGMHWMTFLLSNLLGAALWVGFWTVLAYKFGRTVSIVPFVQSHLYLVISLAVVALIGVILFVYLRLRKAR